MVIGGALAVVRAADEPSSTAVVGPPSVGPAATAIDRLVAGLDAPRFSERQAASEKLAALGASALPALEKAAKGESLEVTARAIELLKKLLDATEESTRADARQALQRLAKGDRPKASRLAQEVLQAKEQEDAANAAGRGRRLFIQNINGGRQVDIEEGNRKIKINDGHGQPIKIEVTTKTNGKDSTQKYEAKDVDELKTKHPEAYKIYAEAPPLDQEVRTAIMVLRSLHFHVDRLIKGNLMQNASPQSKAELKQAIDQFKQTLAEVEKGLREKPETPPAAKPDPNGGAK
jgi:small-conductance mechanosensitive channel